MIEEKYLALQTTAQELRREAALLARQIGSIDIQLAPVIERERMIRGAIQSTHGGAASFNPRRSAERKPMFEALLQISVDHGATKNLRRDLDSRMRAYRREAKTIETLLDKERSKK